MMSNDRFSQCLENICGKYLSDSFEAVITEVYPQLQTDKSLRYRYADYLDSMDVSDTYNTLCSLCKVSKAVQDFGTASTAQTLADNQSIKTYQDPQQVLERILPTIKMMSETFEQITKADNHPLINNILNDNYGYLFAQTMYHNEFNPEYQTKIKSVETADAIVREITSCRTTKDFSEFIQVIEDNADISAKSMMLIGNLHPQFRQLVAENNPEAREFCKLAATFPRSTFAACIEMKAQGKQIKDFASFQAQVGSKQIIQKAKSYNKATVDMIFQSFDTSRPKNDNAGGNITPQKTSNGRE